MLFRSKKLMLLTLLIVLTMLVSACGAAATPEAPAAAEQPAGTTEQAAPEQPAATEAPSTAETMAGPVLMDKPADAGERPVTMHVYNSPADAGGIAEYHEAPELAALVASGDLPAVEERLPVEPIVVEPDEAIGKYGGTLVASIDGQRPVAADVNYFLIEPLTVHNPQEEIVPNVASGWEWNDDYTQLTLTLRKGIKWSDGVPFTSEDIMFWWNDLVLNTELTPTPHALLSRDGVLAELVALDDFTVQFTFSKAYALFTTYLGSWGFPRTDLTTMPKHYLMQFHPAYADMADIEAKMKEEGFDTWVDLFNYMRSAENPNNPSLAAWILNERPPQQVQTYRRNPYYWKVDTAGNQLPYMDGMRTIRIADTEAALLKTIAGELDYIGIGWVGGPANLAILSENKEKADYRFAYANWMPNAYGNIMFNYTSGDETKRELYNQKEFRQALSVAINREEIVKLQYKGGVFPSQIAPARGAPYHGESELFQSWAQYDPELANQMLDDLGLTERDSDGFRMAPNGDKLLLIISATTSWPAETPVLMELVRGYWAAVGINASVAPEAGALWGTRHNNGEHDVSARGGHFGGGPVHPTLNSNTFALTGWQWAPDWALWLDTEGAQGVEPPEDVKKLRVLRDQILGEADEDTRNALMQQVFEIHMDNLWSIGLVVDDPRFGQLKIVKNRVRNVPTSSISGEWYPMVPASWFINE
ncbi:MAG: ABC transporter substrate-binding protein [Caldilineaceae bacterium]|nr:ABC transporter substrate-binding protein [Caldilineaceae bacterium]